MLPQSMRYRECTGGSKLMSKFDERQTKAQENTFRVTAIFSGLLFLVTALQAYTSWSNNELAYALATPKFDITLARGPKEYKGILPVSTQDVIHVSPINGIHSVDNIDIDQAVAFSVSQGSIKYTCQLLMKNMYSLNKTFLDYELNVSGARLLNHDEFNKYAPAGYTIEIDPQSLVIKPTFMDIFQSRKTQTIVWWPGTQQLIDDESDIFGDNSIATILSDKDDKIFLKWTTGSPKKEGCQQIADYIRAHAPPLITGYDVTRVVRHRRINSHVVRTVTTTITKPKVSYR